MAALSITSTLIVWILIAFYIKRNAINLKYKNLIILGIIAVAALAPLLNIAILLVIICWSFLSMMEDTYSNEWYNKPIRKKKDEKSK